MNIPRFVKEYANYRIRQYREMEKGLKAWGGDNVNWGAAAHEVERYVEACKRGLVSPDGCVQIIATMDMEKFLK